MDACVGGWSGIGAAPSSVVKSDAAGCWVDPRAIEIRGSGSAVAEGASTQLTAVVICDDNSVWATGVDFHWSASGPLTSSGSGWMTGHPVYQDTPATSTAHALGFAANRALTVLNTDPDNFGLYAADDIDDYWQVIHFGPLSGSGLAEVDFDGDGANNYYEFTAGTDPLASNDFFALKLIRRGSGIDVGIGPLFTNRTYFVETSPNLLPGAWTGFTNLSLVAPTNLLVLTDSATGTNAAFYRVVIHYPWRNPP